MLEPKNTKIYTVRNSNQARKYIRKAKDVILEGGLVCFPTETVYGLGADAFNDQAVADIFRAKNRSFENPVALHLHSVDEIEKYAKSLNKSARKLIDRFLPGPLMLIFEKKDIVSNIVSGGLRKVGIRVPRHDLCREFLRECQTPVAATSANRSGRLTCVKPESIMEELGGKIDVILDMGRSPLGIESTVLDVTSDPPRIIRPGFITMEEIAVAIGIPPIFSHNVVKSSSSRQEETRKTPRMIVLEGEDSLVVKQMQTYTNLYKDKKIGVLLTDETSAEFEGDVVVKKMGPREEPTEIAHNIFEVLRNLEKKQVDIVLVQGIPREGLGRTLMIKLCRMAEEVIKLVGNSRQPDQDAKIQ